MISMASDAVYYTSRGTVRYWKHTLLGLGWRTFNSKMILRILNHLGHSLSYDEVKALETEFAFSAETNNQDAHDGVDLNPYQSTGLAWDNNDDNMDIIDGNDTLHATVVICFRKT